MKVVALPPAFQRFSEIGGALEFAVFEDVQGDLETALEAISVTVPGIEKDKLRALGSRCIDDQTFFGDWYDAQTKSLLWIGTHTTSDGRTLTDPRLSDLDNVRISHRASSIPEMGGGGQFAYAFSHTPYGLQARPSEVQALFDSIRDYVIPSDVEHEILDWTNPRLPEASAYFTAGAEWWGIFLFTAYVPQIRRLTVVSGSTTD